MSLFARPMECIFAICTSLVDRFLNRFTVIESTFKARFDENGLFLFHLATERAQTACESVTLWDQLFPMEFLSLGIVS